MTSEDFKRLHTKPVTPKKGGKKVTSAKQEMNLETSEASKLTDRIVIVGKCHCEYKAESIIITGAEGTITVKIK